MIESGYEPNAVGVAHGKPENHECVFGHGGGDEEDVDGQFRALVDWLDGVAYDVGGCSGTIRGRWHEQRNPPKQIGYPQGGVAEVEEVFKKMALMKGTPTPRPPARVL